MSNKYSKTSFNVWLNIYYVRVAYWIFNAIVYCQSMNVLSAILSSFILPAELKKIFLLKSFVFYPVPREPPLSLSFCVFLRKNRDTEVLPDILRVWQRIIRRGKKNSGKKKKISSANPLERCTWRTRNFRGTRRRGVSPPPLNSLEGTKLPATIGR